MRLLLVDDDDLFRSALRRTLGTIAVVEEATGVAAALSLLERHQYEVIVTDNTMADGQGTELLATVHARWPSVRRVLMSGEPGASSPSAEVFFLKPFPVEELIAWLQQNT